MTPSRPAGRGSDGWIVFPEQQTCVRAPKPKRIRQRVGYRGNSCLVGHVVKIAVGIRMLEVDRRGNNLVTNDQRGDTCFQATGGAQQVSSHRLRGRDGYYPSMLTKTPLDCQCLEPVIVGRRRAVGVDVVDGGRLDFCLTQSRLHDTHRTVAIFRWRRHVMSIGRHTITNKFAIY